MAKTIIVGDGPGGLSAALFLAKSGHEAVVYGRDETAMHYAHLHNYLGLPDTGGTRFQEVARAQAAGHGAVLRATGVDAVEPAGERFAVRPEDGDEEHADYIILAGAQDSHRLAEALGAERTQRGVRVDTEYRTTVDRVYAVGRAARVNRSQAIISAGAGATAALDILAREAGKDVVDWDTPEH